MPEQALCLNRYHVLIPFRLPCLHSCPPQAAMARLAAFAVSNYDYVEDHIRPVVRRYIPGPVQKKSECFWGRRGDGMGGWASGRELWEERAVCCKACA